LIRAQNETLGRWQVTDLTRHAPRATGHFNGVRF
jgi:hypothetical protein